MTETPGRLPMPKALHDAVQRVLTEYADDIGGASLVGDMVLIFESHRSDGTTALRHIDSDVPSWRQLGMLESAQQTFRTEEIVNALWMGDE